jgi:hypothetical protein
VLSLLARLCFEGAMQGYCQSTVSAMTEVCCGLCLHAVTLLAQSLWKWGCVVRSHLTMLQDMSTDCG